MHEFLSTMLAMMRFIVATYGSISVDEPRLHPPTMPDDWRYRVEVGFRLKDRLRLVAFLQDDTAKAGQAYLIGKNFQRRVHTSGSLRGFVHIRSGKEALAFARLFTAEDTCHIGAVRYVSGAGNVRALEVRIAEDVPKRRYGVVRRQVAQQAGLRPPSIKWFRGYWTIERDMVVLRWWKDEGREGRLYRSHEVVYPDGRYQHGVRRFYPGSSSIRISLPPLAY